MTEIDGINFSVSNSIEIFSFTMMLLGVWMLSSLLSLHYNKFFPHISRSQSMGKTLIMISTITFLIITVVKSSLALSLGLVGALSIIRFRTAVKEQEQIIYLLILTGISISTAAGSFLYPFAFIIFIFIYSFFRYKNSIKVSQTVNDQLIIKGENISEENISSVINLISEDSNVVIQSINKNKNLDTIVLKVSDFSFDKFSVIQSFLENEDINNLSTQYFSSTDI